MFLVVASLPLSCSTHTKARVPSPPSVIDITMKEMAFDHPPTVPAGRVVFDIANKGTLPHRLILVPLADDFPPIREQLHGSERRVISPQAGIADRLPGGNASFAVDLLPGRYALICYVVGPDGLPHALKGMASEFRAIA